MNERKIMLPTQAKVFQFETGRHYNTNQVLEFVFVEQNSDEFTYFVNDASRIMHFAMTVVLDSPECETEESLGRKILNAYDKGAYVGTPWEVESKGREIYSTLKAEA